MNLYKDPLMSLQVLQIDFDLSLPPEQLRAFRAAIAELVGLDQEMFHQHHNSSSARHYHWTYPLIQYCIQKGKAQILGINAGVAAIKNQLLPRLGRRLHWMGKDHSIASYRVSESSPMIGLLNEARPYELYRWVALNKRNFEQWKKADALARKNLLSAALTGHLRAMAEGLGIANRKAIQAEVGAIAPPTKGYWKNLPLLQFKVAVESNLLIPPCLRIGRLSAYGFGQLDATDCSRSDLKISFELQKGPLCPHFVAKSVT